VATHQHLDFFVISGVIIVAKIKGLFCHKKGWLACAFAKDIIHPKWGKNLAQDKPYF
jgi:hypothetical protein